MNPSLLRFTRMFPVCGAGWLVLFPLCSTPLLASAPEAAKENPWTSPPQPNTNLPVLTEIRQIRELPAEQARRQYPVRMKAVVTYFDPHFKTLFIQDDTAGTWVCRTFQETNLYAGDLLELTGASWGFAN